MDPTQIAAWENALTFIVTGIVFVLGGMLTSRLIAPNRPNPEKLSTYECGEEPLGNAWGQFNMRFYVMGLVFLIFDVEILLLFPWASVFTFEPLLAEARAWGWLALLEVGIFVGILLLGLAYIWAKGDIDWIRPAPEAPDIKTGVPEGRYRDFNEQQARYQPDYAPPPALEAESESSSD